MNFLKYMICGGRNKANPVLWCVELEPGTYVKWTSSAEPRVRKTTDRKGDAFTFRLDDAEKLAEAARSAGWKGARTAKVRWWNLLAR